METIDETAIGTYRVTTVRRGGRYEVSAVNDISTPSERRVSLLFWNQWPYLFVTDDATEAASAHAGYTSSIRASSERGWDA